LIFCVGICIFIAKCSLHFAITHAFLIEITKFEFQKKNITTNKKYQSYNRCKGNIFFWMTKIRRN